MRVSAVADVVVVRGTTAVASYNADSRATELVRVSGPTWFTKSGTDITFAPPSDLAAGDYNFLFSGWNTDVSGVTFSYVDQNFLVRVRATPAPIIPVPLTNPWRVALIRSSTSPSYTPYGTSDRSTVYVGTALTDDDDDWTFPPSIINARLGHFGATWGVGSM